MGKFSEIIGEYSSNKEGPLLFVSSAVHGNEPSGVKALENVFSQLNSSEPEINGRLVGILANKKAYEKEVRFIDEDLNRTWKPQNIEEQILDTSEKKTMMEIIGILKSYYSENYTQRYFIDLHTTSSSTEPYISVQDVGNNLQWAQRFPIHIIKGFSDIVSGTIDHFYSRKGLTGYVIEAGQHTSKDSIIYHEGMIWLALQDICGLNLNALKNFPVAVEKTLLKHKEQKTFEIIYRHGLEDSDDFKMQPNYQNFQPIKKGELLALQNGEEIRSKWDAFIFMPLYQSQGKDGFFVVQKI